jgi:hypothetical protein
MALRRKGKEEGAGRVTIVPGARAAVPTPPAAPSLELPELGSLHRISARDVMSDARNGLGERFKPGAEYVLVRWSGVAKRKLEGYRPVAFADEQSTPEIDYVLMERG